MAPLVFLPPEAIRVAVRKEEIMVKVVARAVVVLDENNKVIHSELVPEIANEPNYDAALTALK